MSNTKLNRTNTKKELMLKLLSQSGGIVSHACEKADISRVTHYEWMKEDEEYRAAVDAINEAQIDFAETQLMKLIKGATHEVVTARGDVVEVTDGPNPTATIFYLKTKGKKRGYVEKQELDHSGGPLQIIIDKGI
jgi:hypothetical protein